MFDPSDASTKTGGQDPARAEEETIRILTDPGSWTNSGLDAGDGAKRPETSGDADSWKLRPGSRVAVIGGGPAGSLFAQFLLKTTAHLDIDIDVDIYEPRDFNFCGPAGCNHCGGVVSESLIQLLGTEGVVLPEQVIQRGIDSYVMHMDVGSVQIETPLREKRIAAVYRGNGPRQSEPASIAGFDQHLISLASGAGARVRQQMVTDVDLDEGFPRITCADGTRQTYDLMVVASGVNSALLGILEKSGLAFKGPTAMKSFVAEFKLGAAAIEQSMGTSMHVFLLDIPRLQFAALIPKGEYLTLVMLGDNVDQELVESFLNAPEVRSCFPGGRPPDNACQCFPRLNLSHARRPYADRVVFIGDSGVARLYKDGIGSAYRTAKAAANCVALHGISANDFQEHYWPACRKIAFDNLLGRFVFGFCHLLQKLRFARRSVMRMTLIEQQTAGANPHMSSVLWDVFTGSAPYREVLLRTLHPFFLARLAWNLLAANIWIPGRRNRELSTP